MHCDYYESYRCRSCTLIELPHDARPAQVLCNVLSSATSHCRGIVLQNFAYSVGNRPRGAGNRASCAARVDIDMAGDLGSDDDGRAVCQRFGHSDAEVLMT